MGEFSQQVYECVRLVPKGKVATYGQIARLIGRPRTARFVGYALRSNPAPGTDAESVPCHRVVFKDGGLCGGFAFGGLGVQRALLEAEGVAFRDEDHVDMDACAWQPGQGGDQGDEDGLPISPPPDFDWAREVGDVG